MKKFVLAGILAVIFISGCVDSDLFQGLIGGEGPETTELPPDIIVIQNTNIIPTPPIDAEDQFSISFEVKNQDDLKEVENVKIQLYDYGLCEPRFLEEGETTYTEDIGTLYPGQTEFIEWEFQAPSNDQMVYLSVKCPIRYKVSYDFTTYSQIDVDVISPEELKRLQRTGETPTFTPTQTIGRGPLKIYFDFGSSMPIRASNYSEKNYTLPIYITVEDKGSGIYGNIPKDALSFSIPSDFVVSKCDKFRYDEDSGLYFNNKEIPMIKKKTPQIRCSFITPSVDNVVVEKTYFLTANISYTYDLNQENEIKVEPTLGV
ncbi:MAG: hypothetical protein ACE5J4_01095 [Candidatus Aenigmatarchaeota archaeon]